MRSGTETTAKPAGLFKRGSPSMNTRSPARTGQPNRSHHDQQHYNDGGGGAHLSTTLAVQRYATRWSHTVAPSKRLKKHAKSGLLMERATGETLSEAVGLVDASVAHQRRIRTLFTELEAKEKSYEEAESEEADDDANPIVQAAWQDARTQELRVLKKMNELRDDGACEDSILPVRTIRQMEAHCLSTVAVLKSYLKTGVRFTSTETIALISQMSFAASTVDGLSRWAGEAMETLGHERDRARALHRENAQVSREATMAQKEIMSLEAKLFHSGKEVDVAKAYAAQLKSESGDMKSVVSAIQDSVLAAGMGIKLHDEDGEPLRGTRAVFGMIRALRDACISRQDQVKRLDHFLDEAKAELEQAEVIIKNMAKAASSKRSRKKGAAAPATAAKKQGSDGNGRSGGDGSSSSSINKGPSRQTASALATAAAVTPSSSAGAARALGSNVTTTGHGSPTGSPKASPAPSLVIPAESGTGKKVSPSALDAGGRESPKKAQGAAASAVAGAERSTGAVVSAPASPSKIVNKEKNNVVVAAAAAAAAAAASDRGASEGTAVTTPDGSNGGDNKVATKGTPVAAPVAPVGESSPGKEGTASSTKSAGDYGRGQQRTPPPPQSPPASALSPATSPGHQTHPSSTSIGGKPGEGEEGGKSSTAAAGAATTASPRSIEGGGRIENRHSGVSVDGEVKAAGGSNKNGGDNTRRDGDIDGPLTPVGSEERDDASDQFVLSEAKSCDGDSSTGTLSEGAVVRTLEKAARSTADAMSGLEDALKRALGSSSGIDAAVREGLMEALRNEMELMRDTIKRDMDEVAAEATAAASTERSNIATELAEGAERISQLGSTIHDLQGGLVIVDRVHHAEPSQREGQHTGGGYDPGGMQEGRDRTAMDGAGGTAGDASHAVHHTHDATSQRHPRSEEEEKQQKLRDRNRGTTARQHEPWAEGGVDQRGFRNSLHEEETRREDRGRQSRPYSEGAGGFRREDRGGASSEGGDRRGPREMVGRGSNSGVVQRGRGARTSFSQHQQQQQQQERQGGPRGVGNASSSQQRQESSELSGGDGGRTASSSPPRGGERGGGGERGWAASPSTGSRTAPTPRGLPADAYPRDASSASSDRVGNDSRGGVFNRDRSPPPRMPDGSLDKGGVRGSPPSRGGGERALDQQAVARQGQYGPGRGEAGTGAPTSSVATTEGRRRVGGGGEDGGFRAARGNEPASARTVGDEQTPSRVVTTPPSHPDDAGYSKSSSQRNNADPVGRGGAARGGPAAGNSPSGIGQSGQQRRRDDKTEGGGENVDSASNGKRKGGGGDGGDANGCSAPSRSGSLSPDGATTATATTLKSVQNRPKIQHMAKTMSEVAIAATGGAAGTSPEGTAGVSDTDREPHKGAGAAEARGGDGKGGAAGKGKGMTDRQERALRAFLKGADETQANLAFVALRQEPFLVEEFDYLANQIQDLHETTNGPVPRHLPHAELRDRLRELSARSAPLLRRVRARYRRLHVRWASKLLEALSTRGLAAGDADVSLTCALCGYDWRSAQPRGHRRRPPFHGMTRGDTPTQNKGRPRRQQRQEQRPEETDEPREMVGLGAEKWRDGGRSGSRRLDPATTGGMTEIGQPGGSSARGLFSEKAPLLHSQSAPSVDINFSGQSVPSVGINFSGSSQRDGDLKSSGGSTVGGEGGSVLGNGPRSTLSKTEAVAEGGGMIKGMPVGLPQLA